MLNYKMFFSIIQPVMFKWLYLRKLLEIKFLKQLNNNDLDPCFVFKTVILKFRKFSHLKITYYAICYKFSMNLWLAGF